MHAPHARSPEAGESAVATNESRPTVSTADVILRRLTDGSRPGDRNDEHRVALVVEGGGMRGVVPGGMLLALEQLGMRASFDFVVGTSAGAIASSFFITGLASQVAPIYYRDLNQAPFLNKRRLLRRQPALDLDYLVDDKLMERGLSPHEVAHNPIPLYATVAPVDPENPITVMRIDGDDNRVRSILKATASLPVLGGPAKEVDGEFYVDGGLHSQIPWRAATDLGATHIFVLPSRPIGPDEIRPGINLFERYTVLPLIKTMHGEHIARATRHIHERGAREANSLYAIACHTCSGLKTDGTGWSGEMEFVSVSPALTLPDRLETERTVLVDAMRGGAQAVLDHFGLNNITVEHHIALDHPLAHIHHYRSDALSQIVASHHRALRAESESTPSL